MTGGGSMPGMDQTRMKAEKGSVTVVIPTFRRPEILPRAIKSVLSQTLVPAQVIVVDDGSGDHTSEVARTFPGVTLLQQENAGPPSARNLGLRHATGKYVVSLDHDDEWDETFLQSAVAALESHAADVAWVNFRQTGDYCFDNYLASGKKPERTLAGITDGVVVLDHRRALDFCLFSSGVASNSALLYRREVLGDAGWHEGAKVADDLLLQARILTTQTSLRYALVLTPQWTKHEDEISYSQSSLATVQRCLHDFELVSQMGRDRFSPHDLARWKRQTGNLRYKLAYHLLWDGATGAAWRETRLAFTEAGLSGYALKLLLTICLRKCARMAGIPPLKTWRRLKTATLSLLTVMA